MQKNRRSTPQRKALLNAFIECGRPLSIQELHDITKLEVPTIGLRTIYRLVRILEEEGEIVSVSVSEQAPRYELSSVAEEHHHHFHCKACDRMYDIEGCPGNLSSMLPEGFILSNHELTLEGLCKTCT